MRFGNPVVAALVLLPCASALRAEPLLPGQDTNFFTDWYPAPSGTKVAEKVLPFTVTYLPNRPEKTILSPHTADGMLTSAVYRAADGTLTFRYGIDLEAVATPSPVLGDTVSTR